jgi:hypothetical protein
VLPQLTPADLLLLHRQVPLRRLQRCRVRRTSHLVRCTNPKPLSSVTLFTFRSTRYRPNRSLSTILRPCTTQPSYLLPGRGAPLKPANLTMHLLHQHRKFAMFSYRQTIQMHIVRDRLVVFCSFILTSWSTQHCRCKRELSSALYNSWWMKNKT